MHPQLELLLEIQDLRSQESALREEALRRVESDVFAMRVDEAVQVLRDKVEELEERLDPPFRDRYRTLVGKEMRPIVPVLQGTCYGCFMAVPTAWAAEAERNAQIDICENCGRFLYHLG